MSLEKGQELERLEQSVRAAMSASASGVGGGHNLSSASGTGSRGSRGGSNSNSKDHGGRGEEGGSRGRSFRNNSSNFTIGTHGGSRNTNSSSNNQNTSNNHSGSTKNNNGGLYGLSASVAVEIPTHNDDDDDDDDIDDGNINNNSNINSTKRTNDLDDVDGYFQWGHTGNSANSATSGNSANSATSGNSANSATSGNSATATTPLKFAAKANTDTNTRLTAKPHAFTGAILSPKHALELTPTLCLQIASALADHNNQNSTTGNTTGTGSSNTSSNNNNSSSNSTSNNNNKSMVPYTVWITDAWRVLGWAEPSAALFWEMATMYHALQTAGREMAHHAGLLMIPPILSCGSASSIGSGSGATNSYHTTTPSEQHNNHHHSHRNPMDKKRLSTVASAKELPIWLVGTFLLLHCEEMAYSRNLSGHDERRFSGGPGSPLNINATQTTNDSTNGSNKMGFSGVFMNPSLSPRTRLHASWNNDNTHCTAFLLRHLRKILLLSAVSHNHEATVACMHMAAMPAPTSTQSSNHNSNSGSAAAAYADSSSVTNRLRSCSTTGGKKYDANELRRQHADEHGNVGLQVHLTLEDLERLDFVLHLPSGGVMDDMPLRMGDFLWKCLYDDPPPPTASIPLAAVEREIRQHLELELAVVAGLDDAGKESANKLTLRGNISDSDDASTTAKALSRLTLSDLSKKVTDNDGSTVGAVRSKMASNRTHKELAYNRLRGTTVLLEPNPPDSPSVASVESEEQPNTINNAALGRLHDLVLSDCSDAHFYLLEPFEHATIASCTGCTIVLGAAAGLLYVVDCEKTTITTAARRILISNSSDVHLCVFTPSSPLLVGDNRSCQLAPYNTYYEGMRRDLMTTGLAAAVVSDSISPYHTNRNENDHSLPLLQCASNKWKHPVEMAKLEVPQVPGSPGGFHVQAPLSPGADDRAMGTSGIDTSLQASLLVPPSDFQVLFVPMECKTSIQIRMEVEKGDKNTSGEEGSMVGGSMESQYCRLLAEVLQLSPFRLPLEYERRALMKAERMKNIQHAVQKYLAVEQQHRFEEEINRGFRDWLVSSGNLRQVLDLVHAAKGS